MSEAVTDDPFASTPSANPAECVVKQKTVAQQEFVDPLGGSLAEKPKKVNLNPFQVKWFIRQGYLHENVERKNHYGGVKNDLYGFGDFLAVRGGDTLLVQTTSASNAAARLKKAEALPALKEWLSGPRRFEVHSWSKQGRFWIVKRIEVRLHGDGFERVLITDEETN
jgi:hypothetical protein